MADVPLLDYTDDFSFYWSPSTLMHEYMNVFILCSALILLHCVYYHMKCNLIQHIAK